MSPPSLVSLCEKVAIQNIDQLDSVGDFEYLQIAHVLRHIKTAGQLREIENNSPQIKGEDAELWKKFIFQVDARWHEKNYVPKNPTKWYEVYLKYKREAEKKLKEDEERLRDAMLGLNAEKARHTTSLVETKSLPRVPRDSRMRVEQGRNGKGQQRTRNESALTWGLGSKTKMSDSKGVLLRARREAKEMSMRGKMVVPANRLRGRSTVTQAPPSMIDGYRRASNAPLKIFAPRPGTTAPPSVHPDKEASERRLRALTMGKTQSRPPAAQRTSSDSDADASSEDHRGRNAETKAPPIPKKQIIISDNEDSDPDDLFDEEEPSSPPPKKQAVRSSTQPSQSSRPASNPRLKCESPDLPSSSMARARPAASAARRSGGLGAAAGAAKAPARKRAAVDVFNRQAKKPRR